MKLTNEIRLTVGLITIAGAGWAGAQSTCQAGATCGSDGTACCVRVVAVSGDAMEKNGATVTVAGNVKVVTLGEGSESEENEAAEHEGVRFEIKMEKATYMGISTMPANETLASQLNLPKGQGVVVTHVEPKSPAADQLKVNDVLTKVNDQLVVNPQQLTTLIRTFKAGDEVTLSLIRAGAATTAKAKLIQKEVPTNPFGCASSSAAMRFEVSPDGALMMTSADGTTTATPKVAPKAPRKAE